MRASIMLVAAALGGNAAAMTAPAAAAHPCHVIGGDRLPAGSGGASALCAAIAREARKHAPGIDYHAEIKVISASRLIANVTANGRKLPEQKFASMDRPLARSSFERFARSLATQLAGTRGK